MLLEEKKHVAEFLEKWLVKEVNFSISHFNTSKADSKKGFSTLAAY